MTSWHILAIVHANQKSYWWRCEGTSFWAPTSWWDQRISRYSVHKSPPCWRIAACTGFIGLDKSPLLEWFYYLHKNSVISATFVDLPISVKQRAFFSFSLAGRVREYGALERCLYWPVSVEEQGVLSFQCTFQWSILAYRVAWCFSVPSNTNNLWFGLLLPGKKGLAFGPFFPR